MHLNIPIGGWKISHAVRGERMENQYTRPRHTHPSPCSLSEPRNLGLQLEGRDAETWTQIFGSLRRNPTKAPSDLEGMRPESRAARTAAWTLRKHGQH